VFAAQPTLFAGVRPPIEPPVGLATVSAQQRSKAAVREVAAEGIVNVAVTVVAAEAPLHVSKR
jgi:hypothetical protein